MGKVARCVELLAIVYRESCVGGNCHIVSDDGNLWDDSIQWCLDNSIRHNEHQMSEQGNLAAKQAMELMLTLSMRSRGRVYDRYNEYCGFR